jgi:hypothetical protein
MREESELRLYAKCSMCTKLIGHTGLPLFWRVTLEQFGVLGGGSAALAMAMGPDEEMTQVMTEKLTLSICADCATRPVLMIAAAAEWPDVTKS